MTPSPDPNIERLLESGLSHHRAGRLSEAEAIYRQVVAHDAGDADAHHLLGMVFLARGHAAEAEAEIAEAIRINSKDERYHLNHAKVLDALKRTAESLAALDRAVALRADLAEAWFLRGLTLARLGRPDDALASFDHVLALNPDLAAAHYNRGNVLHELGRFDEAARSYGRAIEFQPGNAEFHYNLGVVLARQRRFAEALTCYDAAIAFKPDSPEAHNNRGAMLDALGRPADALTAYNTAIALRADYAAAFNNRGHVESALKQHEAAVVSYETALNLGSDIVGLAGAALNARMVMCDWRNFEARTQALLADVDAGRNVGSPFALLALPATPLQQRRCAEAHVQSLFSDAVRLPDRPTVAASSKIRLGYFSPDFRSHPLAYLMAGLFERHDRARFEVYGFSYGPPAPHDPMRQRLQAAFDRLVDIQALPDRDVLALARQLGIDIAVDLAGFTLGARTELFAARVADVQVNYLGFPATMGAGFMDYIMADRHTIPENDQNFYTEKVVYLPHVFQMNDDQRAIGTPVARAQEGLDEAAVVLCSFNAANKLNPDIYSTWLDILAQVPQAVLWLIAESEVQKANLRDFASRRGIAPNRIFFAGRRPYADHLARLRLADLALDTLPFNGGATTSDALWAGVPVLTCVGQRFAGRMGASLLHAVGLPELATQSLTAYRALAVELARSPARLAALRETLAAQRALAPLFNTAQSTRHFEEAFTQMHARRLAGLAPTHIHVPAV